jgi:hypothetical protein
MTSYTIWRTVDSCCHIRDSHPADHVRASAAFVIVWRGWAKDKRDALRRYLGK